jgi:hypothetical protein
VRGTIRAFVGADKGSVRHIETVGAKLKRFIVVNLGDGDSFGYNEHELPLLLKMVLTRSPSHHLMTHIGVVAEFVTSEASFQKVRSLISEAEALRDTDPRFAKLAIGVAEGELVGDFDWLGRLKREAFLVGDALVEAGRTQRTPGAYRDRLAGIANSLHFNCA